jgi:hypothetical protein
MIITIEAELPSAKVVTFSIGDYALEYVSVTFRQFPAGLVVVAEAYINVLDSS